MIFGSGAHSLQGVKGLIASLQAQALLHLLLHKLHILQQVGMSLHAFSASDLDHLDAVVAPIHTGSDTEGTAEQAVLESLDAVVEGRA